MASKQTVLDDSAAIYNRAPEKSEKQKWSEMDGKERLSYFKEYYLKKVIIGIFCLGLLIYFGVTIFGPKEENILFVAVVNDYLDDDATAAMEGEIKECLGSTEKLERVFFDDSFYMNGEGVDKSNVYTKMMAYVAAGEIDIMIADPDMFKTYSYSEFYGDLREVLPADMYSLYEDKIVWAEVPVDDEGKVESVPLGISLADSAKYKEMLGYEANPILGIVANTKHIDNVLETINYFFE